VLTVECMISTAVSGKSTLFKRLSKLMLQKKISRRVFCQRQGEVRPIQYFANVTKIILFRCQIFHLKCNRFGKGIERRKGRGLGKVEGWINEEFIP